jgi:NADH:ubiquinone oxidoreductase subunit 5 (subunit L)/multisubunit Na+/H+ antiporter MnhA subunit
MIAAQHTGLATMAQEWHGPWEFVLHGFTTLPFWLALAGIATAWFLYIRRPELPAMLRERGGAFYALLANNYYIDRFNDWFFAGGFRRVGALFRILATARSSFFVDGAQARPAAACSGTSVGYIYHSPSPVIGVLACDRLVADRRTADAALLGRHLGADRRGRARTRGEARRDARRRWLARSVPSQASR